MRSGGGAQRVKGMRRRDSIRALWIRGPSQLQVVVGSCVAARSGPVLLGESEAERRIGYHARPGQHSWHSGREVRAGTAFLMMDQRRCCAEENVSSYLAGPL